MSQDPASGSGQQGAVRGQMDTKETPRFAGPPTFGLLPRRDEVGRCDVVIAGVPFDSGTSYRPGARFGPNAVRQGSRLLRPYHPGLEATPFDTSCCGCWTSKNKMHEREGSQYESPAQHCVQPRYPDQPTIAGLADQEQKNTRLPA